MWKLTIAAVLALGLAPRIGSAQIPWATPTPTTFEGCDGVRSCHSVTARLLESGHFGVDGSYYGKYQFYIGGLSTYFERGGILDCGLGCAWSTNGYSAATLGGADYFHAGKSCWSTSMLPVLGDNARLCSNGTVDDWTTFWGGGFTIFDQNWRPEWIDLRLIYQAVNGSSNVSITTLRLSTVPEPAAVTLIAAGLLAIGLAARARRSS